jgi:alpha-D-xyloside xylohydrolase
MFGPALLVAPVTEQGATSRDVYLPAGSDWYNYWTSERLAGGQTIRVSAPIDTLPLFVRAGSILPLGQAVENTKQVQPLSKLRVYAGADADADFRLYQDDGQTYNYEHGQNSISDIHWDNQTGKLTHTGAKAWEGTDASLLEVIGR